MPDWADEKATEVATAIEMSSVPVAEIIAAALRAERVETVTRCDKALKRAGVGGIARSAIWREFPEAKR